MKVLDGWARNVCALMHQLKQETIVVSFLQVALGAILASSIGWLIFVICFGGFNNADNFYNEIREDETVTLPNGGKLNLVMIGRLTEQDIEEDFPKNRADSDALTYYFFAVVFPLSVIVTVVHLILHAVPVLGFIISLAAHVLLTLSLVCGAGAFWQDGIRLFSADSNFRNEFTSAVVPEDWMTEEYWGSWLVGEWVGLFLTVICVVVYFAMTPFFTNSGRPFSRYNADVELDVKNPNL